MKTWTLSLATLAALAGFVFALPTPEPVTGEAASLAFTSVRLFDGDAIQEGMTVLVEGGRIRAAGKGLQVPAGAQVIDGTGRTLLPGLIDSHTHSWGNALERAVVFGVTTHLDMFTDWHQAQTWRQEQAEGRSGIRADLFSAGTLVTKAGGHGTQFGLPIATLGSAAEADAFVADRLAEGSDWIKLVLEDGHELGFKLPTLSPQEVTAVVAAAHARKVMAVAHVHTLETAEIALDAGIDGLVHLFFDVPPPPDFGRQVAEKGTFVVPTLAVIESIAGTPAGKTLRDDPRLAPWLTAGERQGLGGTFGALVPAEGLDYARQTVAQLRAAGVPILAGSDAPNPGTTWGASLHRELELLVSAGLTPLEALRAATSVPAAAFHLADRGRIAPGLKADLLLVEGDPSQDITATRAIAGVWKDGREVPRPRAEAPAPTAGKTLSGVLSRFDDGTLSATSGAGWSASTDEYMGGASTVELLTVPAGEGKALEVAGEIRPGFPYPWAGAMLSPGEGPMAPVDIGPGRTLVFRARGDALRVMIFAESLGMRPSMVQLPASEDWQQREVRLEDLGVDGAGVKAFLFSGGLLPGPFRFEIDDVELRAP